MTTPASMRIIRHDADRYIAVSTGPDGREFEHSVCVCADQAAYTVAHGVATRAAAIVYTGMVDAFGRQVDPSPCSVSHQHWTWQHHGFTHGWLAKFANPEPAQEA